MPRLAILSDIHGNLSALQAVLSEIEKTDAADEIIFGGDIVGYGASPAECVQLVREHGGNCVLGNHEFYVNQLARAKVRIQMDKLNPVEAGINHALDELSDEEHKWIQDLPWSLPIDDQTVIAHSALHEPDEWHYIRSLSDAQPTMQKMTQRDLNLAFFGHVHVLACYSSPELNLKNEDLIHLKPESAPIAITVGSVGQPRELHDNRATWVIFDSEAQTVEYKRTKYDAYEAAEAIVSAGLPEHSALRLL